MQEGAAELAVGDGREPDLLLPGDDLRNLGVLDDGELGGGPRWVARGETSSRHDRRGKAGGDVAWTFIPVNGSRPRPSHDCGLLPLPKGEGWGEGLQRPKDRCPLTPTLSPIGRGSPAVP